MTQITSLPRHVTVFALFLLLLVSCKEDPSTGSVDGSGSPKHKQAATNEPEKAATVSEGEKISFSTEVLPILSNNCFACHGPDSQNQTSPFRLDTADHSRANLAKEGEPARHGIVPGKPEASLLLQRIVSTDPHEIMPPPYAKKPALTEEQIATLSEWIRQGAEYEPHWAFVAP